jgi:hypothetical protein
VRPSDPQSPNAPPAPPRTRRRWRRRLLWAVAVALLLVALAPLALALPFVRNAVADRVGESLGARVEIASISGFWGRGVDLEGIVVHSP